MAILAYRNMSDQELNALRTTSEGKNYTLNHPEELVVNMRYKGEGKSNANSQGWERSSLYYFKELQKSHPEYFSKKNSIRIENGESPKVDSKFVRAFPQYKGYENETLVHHHIGKDGQAVAVPQSMHKGSGEIHAIENELGVTDEARAFSDQCEKMCVQNPSLMGKSADYFQNNKSNIKPRKTVEMNRINSERALVRRREVTPAVKQSRSRDIDAILDIYRENLHDHGVTDEAAIDEFVSSEREKYDAEYASLDQGDEYPQMYETPTDWEGIASSMKQNDTDNVVARESLEHFESSVPHPDQSQDNPFSSATSQGIGESRERHSSENAFSRATKPSPESAPDSGLSEKRASYDQSLSGGNAFSEASSHSDHSGFSGGSAEGISQEQSFSESRSK